MTKRGRTYSPLLIAAVLALAAAGCGVKTTSDATTPTVTAPPDSSDTTVAPETTTTTETTDTTETERSTVPNLPPGTEKIFRDQLIVSFEAGGLTGKQASCLADAYLKRFGTDVRSAGDRSVVLDLLSSCDISPTDFGN